MFILQVCIWVLFFLTSRVTYPELPHNISISFHVSRMKKFKSIYGLKNPAWLAGTDLSVSRKNERTYSAGLE